MFTAVMSRITISCATSSTNSSRPLFLPVGASGPGVPWRWLRPGPVFGVAVLVVGFGLVIHSKRLAERLGRLANTIARPVVSRSKKHRDLDFVPMLLDFRHSVVDLVRRRRASLTATRLLVSFTEFLILLAALRGVEGQGPHTSFLVAFGAWAVAQIGIMIPITPGGLGTVDAFLIVLLTAMGVPDGDATAADLVWRAASYVQQIVIGVLCLVTWSKRAAKTFAAAPREVSGLGSGAAVPPDLARRG